MRTNLPQRVSGLLLASAAAALCAVLPAAAEQGACEACRTADVEQVGGFVRPDVEIRKGPDMDLEVRGKVQKIPVPGAAPLIVRLKPGAGVWVGGLGQDLGDIFVAGERTGAKAQWRIGF